MTIEEILGEYEGLEREDILACLAFASEALKERGTPEIWVCL
jgi:uncharacterized protein (DUF433 family)